MNLTRRAFLQLSGASAMAGGWPLGSRPRMVFRPAGYDLAGDILISVFLRGAMDGLSAVVPHAEARYHQLRSSTRIPDPDQTDGAIDLDGFFGLHPALEPLKDIYTQQDLAIVHASGSPHPSRSHFEAQDFMERGAPGDTSVRTGWIARHLDSMTSTNDSPFRALGWGNLQQLSLFGPVEALSMKSIEAFNLNANETEAARVKVALQAFYGGESELDTVGQKIFSSFDFLTEANPAQYEPQHGASYAETGFAQGMKQIGQIIRANMGLEAVAIDINGWDTHAAQGGVQGPLANLLQELAGGLSAFYTDMQDDMHRITVVVMSEFGRRAQENASKGTDHGHGNAMFLMGGGVNGGKVYGAWPGLADEALDRGDLAVTTDYRTILSEIVKKRLLNGHLSLVFPNFQQTAFLGVVEDRALSFDYRQFLPNIW